MLEVDGDYVSACDSPYGTWDRPDQQLHDFVEEFTRPDWLKVIVTRGFSGLQKSLNRGLYWRILTGCLPNCEWADIQRNPVEGITLLDNWVDSTEDEREFYIKIKRAVRQNLQTMLQNKPKPAAKTVQKMIEGCISDEEGGGGGGEKQVTLIDVHNIVNKDLDRLHMGGEGSDVEKLLRTKPVRAMMENILIVWANQNPLVSYRQGMHELLAPLMLMLMRDARRRAIEESKSPPVTADGAQTDRGKMRLALTKLSSFEHLEADTYLLLDVLLRWHGLYEWYQLEEAPADYKAGEAPKLSPTPFGLTRSCSLRPTNAAPIPPAVVVDPKTGKRFIKQGKSPIVLQCRRIQRILLKKQAGNLKKHLDQHEIEPQVYGLRMLRLLFMREMKMEYCMVLWDSIFADLCVSRNLFAFVPQLCVTLLLHIESPLISSDYEGCLKKLLKFPSLSGENPSAIFAYETLQQLYPEAPFTKGVIQPEVDNMHPLMIRRRSQRASVKLFDEDEDEEEDLYQGDDKFDENKWLMRDDDEDDGSNASPTSPTGEDHSTDFSMKRAKVDLFGGDESAAGQSFTVKKKNRSGASIFDFDDDADPFAAKPEKKESKIESSFTKKTNLFDEDEAGNPTSNNSNSNNTNSNNSNSTSNGSIHSPSSPTNASPTTTPVDIPGPTPKNLSINTNNSVVSIPGPTPKPLDASPKKSVDLFDETVEAVPTSVPSNSSPTQEPSQPSSPLFDDSDDDSTVVAQPQQETKPAPQFVRQATSSTPASIPSAPTPPPSSESASPTTQQQQQQATPASIPANLTLADTYDPSQLREENKQLYDELESTKKALAEVQSQLATAQNTISNLERKRSAALQQLEGVSQVLLQ